MTYTTCILKYIVKKNLQHSEFTSDGSVIHTFLNSFPQGWKRYACCQKLHMSHVHLNSTFHMVNSYSGGGKKKSVIVCLFWNRIAGLKWKRWQGKTTGVSWKPQLLWFLETQLSCTERKPITCPIVWGPRGEQASPWTINTNSLTIIPKLQCYTLKLELE